MKKVLLAMSAAFILYACGGGGDKPAEVKKDTTCNCCSNHACSISEC